MIGPGNAGAGVTAWRAGPVLRLVAPAGVEMLGRYVACGCRGMSSCACEPASAVPDESQPARPVGGAAAVVDAASGA
jgi:hypothetical protein